MYGKMDVDGNEGYVIVEKIKYENVEREIKVKKMKIV
jgi:hypothetical protein